MQPDRVFKHMEKMLGRPLTGNERTRALMVRWAIDSGTGKRKIAEKMRRAIYQEASASSSPVADVL